MVSSDEVLQDLGVVVGFYCVYSILLGAVEPEWTGIDRLYFISATVTTTGFGDLTTRNSQGRIVTIVMMLTGLVLVWRMVEKYGGYLHRLYLLVLREKKETTEFRRFCCALLPLSIVAFLAWIAAFIHMELNFVDALYFTCVTFTTVGYGDHAPSSKHGRFALAFFLPFFMLIVTATAKELRRLDARRVLRAETRPSERRSKYSFLCFQPHLHVDDDDDEVHTTEDTHHFFTEDPTSKIVEQRQLVEALARAGVADKWLLEELRSIMLLSDTIDHSQLQKRRRSSLDDLALHLAGSVGPSPSGPRRYHFPPGSGRHTPRQRFFLCMLLSVLVFFAAFSETFFFVHNTTRVIKDPPPVMVLSPPPPSDIPALDDRKPLRNPILNPEAAAAAAARDDLSSLSSQDPEAALVQAKLELHKNQQAAKQNQASVFLAASATYDPPLDHTGDDDETPLAALDKPIPTNAS